MRTPKLHFSLSTKWLAFQIIGLSLVLGLVGLHQYYSIRADTYADIKNSGDVVSMFLKEMLAEEPKLINNEKLEASVVRLSIKIPDIERISVIDPSQHIIADSQVGMVG